MRDKNHVIIIIITILNKKLEISKIAVKKADPIWSGPKRYHYRYHSGSDFFYCDFGHFFFLLRIVMIITCATNKQYALKKSCYCPIFCGSFLKCSMSIPTRFNWESVTPSENI